MPEAMPRPRRLLALVAIGAVVGGAIVLATAHAQRRSRQALPPRILAGYAHAQGYFRDKTGRYATSLDQLGTVDAHWSTRLYTDYNGYTYEGLPAPADPAFTWAARATPVEPSWPHFYVDHTGVTRVEPGRPAGPTSPPWKPVD